MTESVDTTMTHIASLHDTLYLVFLPLFRDGARGAVVLKPNLTLAAGKGLFIPPTLYGSDPQC